MPTRLQLVLIVRSAENCKSGTRKKGIRYSIKTFTFPLPTRLADTEMIFITMVDIATVDISTGK
jgi:hypothetical protein